MVQRIRSGTVDGIDGLEVGVEVDAGRGLPSFQIVGLPSTAVRESRERVLAAVRNSGLAWPAGRVVVNLAPADVEKRGPSVDLAIAVGVCAAGAGRDADASRDAVLLGELSLDGAVRPVRGLLSIVATAAAAGRRLFVVPRAQAWEATLVPDVVVLAAADLRGVVAWRSGEAELPRVLPRPSPAPPLRQPSPSVLAFFAEAPPAARRLAVVAAAGRHDTLLVGPPGTGKTQLARATAALQPPLAVEEAFEVTRIHGAAGLLRRRGPDLRRPFRAPHHTVTRAGLLGGGAALRPGEATLAHRGILFLDELSEFAPPVLDALREPLEQGSVAVSRGGGVRTWPADLQLLAATNPCRCGWLGSEHRECRCSRRVREEYRSRLSGPFLDRLDLFLEMTEAARNPLAAGPSGSPARPWREAVAAVAGARELLLAVASGERPQRSRPDSLDACRALLDSGGVRMLDEAAATLRLSARSVLRCAGVARTLAALAGEERAGRREVVEALSYRREQIAAFHGS